MKMYNLHIIKNIHVTHVMSLYNREIFYIQLLDLNKLFLNKQKIVCRIKLFFSSISGKKVKKKNEKKNAINVDFGCLFIRSMYCVF